MGVRPAVAGLALAALLGGCSSLQAARHYDRGTEALDHGNPDRAVAELEQAAALEPQASEIQNHLGIAYQQSGRPADALAAFERAVELDCSNQAAQHNLEWARERMR